MGRLSKVQLIILLLKLGVEPKNYREDYKYILQYRKENNIRRNESSYDKLCEFIDKQDVPKPKPIKKYIETDEYKNRQRSKNDKLLFKKFQESKIKQKELKQLKQQKKESIKTNAIYEYQIKNVNNVYETTKNEKRKIYEKTAKKLNKEKFQWKIRQYIAIMRKHSDFEIKLTSIEKRKAFQQAIRILNREIDDNKFKPIMYAIDENGRKEYLTIGKESIKNIKIDIEKIIKFLDDRYEGEYVTTNDDIVTKDEFHPIIFGIKFLEYNKKNKKLRKRKYNKQNDNIDEEEIDLHTNIINDGEFWKYLNTSNIDLSVYQIFSNIDPNNYTDNCFVYACIQSGVFTDLEIESLRMTIRTRKLPKKLISKIARTFKCHFIVKYLDDTIDITRQQLKTRVDTRKNIKENYDRTVTLLLWKEHYMIWKNLPIAPFYIKNKAKIDKMFPNMTIEEKQLIRGLNDRNYPKFLTNDMGPTYILRSMFEAGFFKEMTQCDQDLLRTCEFTNKLKDFTTLEYPIDVCTKLIETKGNFTKWSAICYSDFETDVTTNPHTPYLNCTLKIMDRKAYMKDFTGDNIGKQLLDYLPDGSLTYFHNLKYDVCFFINESKEYDTQITERNGTVLQLKLYKYDNNGNPIKELTFRNSYSLIPAPLKDFAGMFHLDAHKEVMAYKIYTKENIERQYVTIEEYLKQLDIENENKTDFEKEQLHEQFLENCNTCDCILMKTVDIMKYAKYYCRKDVEVLFKGMQKFNQDLKKVFSEGKCKFGSIHSYLSISAVGYAFCLLYGCMNETYELAGKPQQFISRCVSGGRTMVADNIKIKVSDNKIERFNGKEKLIENTPYEQCKIQDFDAVSLYPSAMHIMNGIPKGIPKVIPNEECVNKDIFKYDTFFVEINIKSLKCKSQKPYKFGQVFHKNDAGSKIYDNTPINNFYIDKRALEDLLEYYYIEYEIIRGYYFNDGFNTKINAFIKKLFDLRVEYKNEGNPLQTTIKLLLNSIYGKSILKPIEIETKCINKEDLDKFIIRNYNFITQINEKSNVDKCYCKIIKPINDHYNLPQFGATVLSWSKHLMNKVISLSEQNNIEIFYQDTDSIHVLEQDVPKISELFKQKYAKTLIGSQLTQFHNDFDGFSGSVGKIHSRKLIALGKKSYLDILVDENGNEGYHIRLKGIPKQVVINKAKRLGITIEELYEKLYNGEIIYFDLLGGSNCFKKTLFYEQTTLSHFERKIKF